MRIGILGGTFDPIHQGHLLLARSAQKQFVLDKVLFIPAKLAPHKIENSGLTPAPHRYRMAELAVLSEPSWEVSDLELTREGISYTVDTLRELKRKAPEDKLFLILGMDNLLGFSTWKEPEAIFNLAEVLVARRPGCPRDSQFWDRVHSVQMQETAVSASEIREKIRRSEKVGEDILPAQVQQYIHRHGLYR